MQARQNLAHTLGNGKRIAGRLLDDAQAQGLLAADTDDLAVFVGTGRGITHIPQANRIAVGFRDDHVVERFRALQIGFRQHGEFPRGALDAPAGRIQILAQERSFHVLHGETLRGEALAIDPCSHRILALTADDHGGHAGQRLQRIEQIAIGVIRHFHRRVTVAGQRDPHDRPGIGFDLVHHRVERGGGQLRFDTGYPVAHVVGGVFHVAAGEESRRDLADFLAALRFDGLDAFDAGEHIFDGRRDNAFHHLCRGALVHGAHRYGRRIDLRILAYRKTVESYHAQQHDEQAHHGGKHRAFDGNFGEDHGVSP